MKLIDITNSHLKLVKEQLANTDAFFVKVYSLGQTTVIYEDAATHKDIVIINHKRRVKDNEIEFVVHRLLHTNCDDLDIIYADNFVEKQFQNPAAFLEKSLQFFFLFFPM